MRLNRDSFVRRELLAFSFLFIAAVVASMVLASEIAFARDVSAWLGVGPLVVNDGYLGGNDGNNPPKYCATCDSTGSVQCPDYNKTGCGGTYSGCYCSQDTDCSYNGRGCSKTCSTTGNEYECGTGGSCASATTSSCPTS